MLNLAKPFAGFDRERMEAEAFGARAARPHVPARWAPELRAAIASGWDADPGKRLSMVEFARVLGSLDDAPEDQIGFDAPLGCGCAVS